jgi:hypothetical protein
MDRDPRANELANLKEALANFEHQLDAFEARAGYSLRRRWDQFLPAPTSGPQKTQMISLMQ